GLRGVGRERQHDGAEAKRITVPERRTRGDAPAVDEGAVRTLEIDDAPGALFERHSRVMTGHTAVVQRQVGRAASSDDHDGLVDAENGALERAADDTQARHGAVTALVRLISACPIARRRARTTSTPRATTASGTRTA